MICKWCAAQMSQGETVCRRCGKEAPALSDCGGFYDLVPQAAPRIPVADVEVRPARKKGPLGFLCVLLAVALAVSLIACVVISGENQELKEELEELEELLEDSDPVGEPTLPPIPQAESTDSTAGEETATETIPSETE